jgi:hypothetical protein
MMIIMMMIIIVIISPARVGLMMAVAQKSHFRRMPA